MLSEEQVKQIKEQLIQQINSSFPEEKKQQALKQVELMNNQQLEEFLIQNNLIDTEETPKKQCIFCSIIKGDINSYKIAEENDSLAILEINPISKGHLIIIPKNHGKVSEKDFSFAKNISEKIKKELNPKDIQIYTSSLFDHEVINVLPIYNNETSNSEKKPAKKQELEEIQERLKEKPKPKKPIEIQKPKRLDNMRVPKRIP